MGAPEKKFVVLTASRSGSTALIRALHQHPDVHAYGHPFFAQQHKRKWSKRYPDAAFDFDRFATAPVEFVNALLEQGHAACRGFKIWPLPTLAATRTAIEALCRDTSVRKIVLHRENELATYSSWRFARGARRGMEDAGQGDQIRFDAEDFDLHLKSRQKWFTWRDGLIGDDALHVPYTDLMTTGIHRIAEDLGLAPFQFLARTQKRNTHKILDRFVPEDRRIVLETLRNLGREGWVQEIT